MTANFILMALQRQKIDVDPQIFLMKAPQNSNFPSQFFNVPGGPGGAKKKQLYLKFTVRVHGQCFEVHRSVWV